MAPKHSNPAVGLTLFLLVALGILVEAEVFRFDKSAYTVEESAMSSVQVCVVASTSASTGLEESTVNVSISTMSGTAEAISDYTPIFEHQLIFTQGNVTYQNKCIDINVTNDDIHESEEYFYISVGEENKTLSTATVSILDDDTINHLECAEDTYIITVSTTELTVCVMSNLVCTRHINCTVASSEGITNDPSIEILNGDVTGHTTIDCAKLTFSSLIESGEFNINFIKNISGNSSENSRATCRVKVISLSEVPMLFLELNPYYVLEGRPLEICGSLVDETGEFEPAETLTATFTEYSGAKTSLTLNYIGASTYYDVESGETHPATKYCGSTTIIVTDNMRPERVRYFAIELSGPELNAPGIRPRSGFSNLFVTDDDGPNVECNDVTGILSDGQSCFQELGFIGNVASETINCYFQGATDCTYWKYLEYEFFAENPKVFQNYFPFLSPHSRLFDQFQSLYFTTPTPECSTQCVVFSPPSSPESCPKYILIMDEVFTPAALEFHGTTIVLEDSRFGQNITLLIACCGLDNSTLSTCTDPAFSQKDIIGLAVGGAVVAVCVLVLPALLCYVRYRGKKSKEKSATAEDHEKAGVAMENPNYQPNLPGLGNWKIQHRQSASVDIYAPWRKIFASVIIDPSQLKTQEVLGEGAFGQVHKGSLITSQETASTQVAIKSLKDSPNEKEVDEFIAESAIMLDFSHPNVMRLVGVCFDTEDRLPLTVLPYMENGDLKTFLRAKRLNNDGGTSTGSADHFPPGITDAILIGMCLDIAKGMEYLSRSKFVHRDLAARNCMVDKELRVCVADFGLSKDVYSSEYYRLTHAAPLPIKWMAPESLHDNVYNEKTDVWSFGVVCWEVFSLGRVPFPGLDNADIPDYISRGHRLRQPSLCPNEMNTLMQSTWEESPNERPTFLQLVYSLANVLGQDVSHEYSFLEEPQHEL